MKKKKKGERGNVLAAVTLKGTRKQTGRQKSSTGHVEKGKKIHKRAKKKIRSYKKGLGVEGQEQGDGVTTGENRCNGGKMSIVYKIE